MCTRVHATANKTMGNRNTDTKSGQPKGLAVSKRILLRFSTVPI
jgi:hypothetical protein